MTTTIALIKQLREITGAGVLDCRRALEEANANYEQALAILRELVASEAARRANREASQGRVELYSHGNGRIGVMVEVNCETDFAARSEFFCGFAHELALHIAAAAPRYVCDEEIPADVLAEEAEKVTAQARSAGKPDALIPRIVEGYLTKFKNVHVLLRQVSIRDEGVTVAELLNQAAASVGENIVIRRFVHWELADD